MSHNRGIARSLLWKAKSFPDPLDNDLRRFTFLGCTRLWPSVTAADIYLYLVEGTCYYTKEEFRSFKMSEGYNFFINGKVQDVRALQAGKTEKVVLLTATVEASQTVSKQYTPWTLVHADGKVANAHCTCMDGQVVHCYSFL
ncbi:hypothetical protein HPB47_001998 [Ixodes persulcatus]|uniref:Uncharacterized protein n=1 Tax=Ixodes persulcatus TaxID=34615 RepID=A0AC60PMV7_IXOPE|nr:hypothetical protein HPB47_001998 [Ixodes persulcatus]